MKKRFLAATLAGICAVASLGTVAFADSTQTDTANQGSGIDIANESGSGTGTWSAATNTYSVAVDSDTSIPDIKVTLPSTMAYVANPYKLTVNVDDVAVAEKIISPEFIVENNGGCPVTINVTGTAVTAGSAIVNSTGKIASKTDKELALWVSAGTKGTDGKYTYATTYNAKTCALIVKETNGTKVTNAVSTPTDLTVKADVTAYNKAFEACFDVKATNAAWKAAGNSSDLIVAGTAPSGTNPGTLSHFELVAGTEVSQADAEADSTAGDCIVYKYVKGEEPVKATEVSIMQLDGKKVVVGTNDVEVELTGTALTKARAALDDSTSDPIYVHKDSTLAAINAKIADESNLAPATFKADLAAMVTKTAADALTEKEKTETFGSGRFKICGDINSTPSSDWTTADTATVSLAFRIGLVANS